MSGTSGSPPFEAQALGVLSKVLDPDLNQDIVSLGFVKNMKIEGGSVQFDLELTTPACPVKDQLKQQCEDQLQTLDWVEKVHLTLTAQPRKNPLAEHAQATMAGVKSIIAVSSCKGGVGKSTVSTNLAVALSQRGAKVGLLDADIYGPSLPTMLGLGTVQPRVENQHMIPIEAAGLKVMSAGFLMPQSDAAVLRGPMISNLMQQLLLLTEWGELDYLVLDMPPGTGDVQLTITQNVRLTGAVIVTTPQKMSLIDVAKGINMFSKVSVPILGVVENMSYLMQGDQKINLYGESGVPHLAETYGMDILAQVPFYPEVVGLSDRGRPAAADHGNPWATTYDLLSESVVRKVAIEQNNPVQVPVVDIDW
jgi:ATP-binding protein involved in chromosome partitioning